MQDDTDSLLPVLSVRSCPRQDDDINWIPRHSLLGVPMTSINWVRVRVRADPDVKHCIPWDLIRGNRCHQLVQVLHTREERLASAQQDCAGGTRFSGYTRNPSVIRTNQAPPHRSTRGQNSSMSLGSGLN